MLGHPRFLQAPDLKFQNAHDPSWNGGCKADSWSEIVDLVENASRQFHGRLSGIGEIPGGPVPDVGFSV